MTLYRIVTCAVCRAAWSAPWPHAPKGVCRGCVGEILRAEAVRKEG